ncbi:MAG: ATPase, T2SS/T4P/T4SS family [Oscillospiraceae bacterium]
MIKDIKLGEVLISGGYITETQLQTALKVQKEYGSQKLLGEVLTELKFVTEEQVLSGLSQKLGLKTIQFSSTDVDVNYVKLLPKEISQKYNLIAIGEEKNGVVVVMNDPLNFYATEDIKLILGRPVIIRLAKLGDIQREIRYWYGELDAQKAATDANVAVDNRSDFKIENLDDTTDETPIVQLVNSTLFKAYTSGASDLHFEAFEDKTIVRIRVDGQMLDFLTLAQSLHQGIVARIKILSGLDIAEKRLPQDGHFHAKLQGIELNVRTSILPTVYGEKIVLRFLGKNTYVDDSDTFGMSKEDVAKFNKILESPYGIIYFTGPTGSGKTTTLYMVLAHLAKQNINIATIEDPVEQNLDRVNQTQTNNTAGLTFAAGLRAILRQDPDVIMVGETRDSETASIAVRSAITGHLVLSTLHTNDSVSAVPRLLDMGVENYLISSSLVGVVAQRLVKKLCTNCRKEYQLTPMQEHLFGYSGTAYKPVGCPECNYTGYKGRRAIHEVLYIDKELRKLIGEGATMDDIYNYVKNVQHLETLKDGLIKLVKNGTTSAQELERLTYFE